MSQFSWDLYGAEAMRHYARSQGVTAPPPLDASGLYVDTLPADMLQRLSAAFDACEPALFEADDTTDGYYGDPQVKQAVMREHTSAFHRPSPALLTALGDWLAAQAAELERLMGHHWAVRQTWSHAMRVPENNNAEELAAAVWHTDGAPLCMKKIMIYLDGASLRLGSTEFRLRSGETTRLDGPPGVWALFENSAVSHRALPPRQKPRRVIELMIVPAMATEPRPEAHSINSGYPWFPWPAAVGKDDGLLPAAFRRDALAARVHGRLIGLARAVPTADLTLGIDVHQRRG